MKETRGNAGTRGRLALGFIMILLLGSAGAGLYRWRGWLTAFSQRAGVFSGGIEAYQRGEYTLAADIARARLLQKPRDTEAVRLLARSSARLGLDSVATALFNRIGDSDRADEYDPDDYYLIGCLVAQRGDSTMAEDSWRLSLKGNPNHPEALAALVGLHLKNDQLHDAAALAVRLAAQRGWTSRGNVALAEIRSRLGDHEASIEALRKACGDDQSKPSLIDRERASVKPREPAILPSDLELTKRFARGLLRLGQANEAYELLSRSKIQAAGDAEFSWLLSRASLLVGKMADASDALDDSQNYRDDHPLEPEPAVFVGEARCAECHQAIARRASVARHARTFAKPSELRGLPLPAPGIIDPHDPRAKHSLLRQGDTIRMETQVDGQTYKAVVAYAIGSGDRGMTLLGRDDTNTLRELRLSRYGNINPSGGWDVTTGHRPKPETNDECLGRSLPPDKARGCLLCHTTDTHSKETGKGAASADQAIGCERCHGPGGNHIAAVKAGFADLAIAAEPARASAGEVIGLCGQCHSPRGTMTISPDDSFSVRFQATTLTWSRCYTRSGEELGCLTCHDPHSDAQPEPSHYERKCLACHDSTTKGASTSVPSAGVCSVNPASGCITCHMPVVTSTRVPHTPFTDHNIRVHLDTRPPKK